MIRDGNPQWLSLGSEAQESSNFSAEMEAREERSRMQLQSRVKGQKLAGAADVRLSCPFY